jgi:lipopolysaccharide heptosyltransferase II
MERSQRRLPQQLKRILVVRTDRLGDVVLTLPVLSLLRRHFPKARIGMLLRRYTGAIVLGNPHLDEVHWYDGEGGNVAFAWMLRQIKSACYDAVVVVHPTFRLALLLFLAGVPLRVGSGYRYYSLLFNRRVFEHRRGGELHEAEYNVRLLGALGMPDPLSAGPLEFPILITEDERQRAETRLRSLGVREGRKRVILHPGSGGSAKDWPVERFSLLAQRLSSIAEIQVLVTGLGSERDPVQSVVEAGGEDAVDLSGKCTVRELAAVIGSANLFVSNSTGPLHIASALETPLLGFYSQIPAMSPRRWGPYGGRSVVLVPDRLPDCRKCQKRNSSSCECIESISVEEAYNAAISLLTRYSSDVPEERAHV